MSLAAQEGFSSEAIDDVRFEELALRLFRIQSQTNLCYQRYLEAMGCRVDTVSRWEDIPCVPAAAFKELEVTSIPEDARSHVFRSSGTTQQDRGAHYHSERSLALYEQSLFDWFQQHLLADDEAASELSFFSLTPQASDVPESSLVHMLDIVGQGGGYLRTRFFGFLAELGGWELALDDLLDALRRCCASGEAVCLAGTAFNFVQLLDGMTERGVLLNLPVGSRLLETGGYKGRTRELSKSELYASLSRSLDLSEDRIVCEYGMSELSSQAYDQRVHGKTTQGLTRRFKFAPWARVKLISPETGQQTSSGEVGLIQVFDLANVWSVMAVQTEDLGTLSDGGFELLGRAREASPKGCSLLPEL